MELRICHLYGDLMNIYGDDGNIITLAKRAAWREIEAKLTQVTIGDKIDPNWADIYFFGGGQDQQQIAVSGNLQKVNGKLLEKAVKKGAVVLSICGGYQLLGKYYKPKKGSKLPGIALIDAHTVAGNKRMIGNIVIEVNRSLFMNHGKKDKKSPNYELRTTNYLVGFENHSGQTFLGKTAKPLGRVVRGFGNNGKDKTEGAWQQNVFGCYLHGSLLPKNPHFADYLIAKALARRYGIVKLKPLDDSAEWQAHQSILRRLL